LWHVCPTIGNILLAAVNFVVMNWDKNEHCKKELGIQEDHFIYDGEKYRVDYTMTYNVSLSNEGTPFVVGSKVNDLTSHLKIKTFLVDEWVA